MKAAAFSTIGPPEVLRVMDFEDPKAGNGQIRVNIKAAGVQPADCGIRGSGWAPPGVTLRMPQILGNEFAGTVDQVGEGVMEFEVGDDVIGWSLLACYAEYVVVSADQVVRKPDSMPWEEAGALTASGQTAHTALGMLGVGHKDTVLIHAAAGESAPLPSRSLEPGERGSSGPQASEIMIIFVHWAPFPLFMDQAL